MKLTVISTTIRGDSGYRDYDELAAQSDFSSVNFVISGDIQSPEFSLQGFKCPIEYMDAKAQEKYHCSSPIGWKKFARRNIALLRAMESDPDYILMVDDDNRPSPNYFNDWFKILNNPVTQIAESDQTEAWHNYLRTGDTDILIYPRGFPIVFRDQYQTRLASCDPIPIDKVGVFQGISLGDPDIDAITRIVYSKPTPLNKIDEKNFCLQNIWSPYNTQNTLFSKKLFPLAFTWPNSGRFEDIYASLVWQRFLFANDMYVHVGDAMNYQIRGKRNDLRDFSLEVDGYLHIHDVWECIKEMPCSTTVELIQALTNAVHKEISKEREFFESFLRDLEKCKIF